MSYSWSKIRCYVYVTDDALIICEVNGKANPKIINKQTINILENADSDVISSTLASIDSWLNSKKGEKYIDIDFILGLTHVRYLVLPWSEKLVSKEFRIAISSAFFLQQFHEDTSKYEAIFSTLTFESPLTVAFVERELVSGIKTLANRYNCKVRSMQPVLMVVWNKFEKLFKRDEHPLYIWDANRVLKIQNKLGFIQSMELAPFSTSLSELRTPETLKKGMRIRIFPPLFTNDELKVNTYEQLTLTSSIDQTIDGDIRYLIPMCGIN